MVMERIVFFGECMIELSGMPLNRTFGGDTLNTALYLARLLEKSDIQVQYATGVGQDSLSDELLLAWQEESINTDLVARIPNKTPGLYLVETDSLGERFFHYWRSDSAAKHYFSHAEQLQGLSLLEEAINTEQVDAFYISGISVAILEDSSKQRLIRCIRVLKQQGKTVIFDNNYRPQLWSTQQAQHWYEQILAYTDIALITEEDDHLVWGKSCVIERCQAMGCRDVVIKRGENPCLVVTNLGSPDEQRVEVAATKVQKVVDTCAAGDSFAAGYLAGYFSGKTPFESATLGHQLAGIVIQHPGAIIPTQIMTDLQVGA